MSDKNVSTRFAAIIVATSLGYLGSCSEKPGPVEEEGASISKEMVENLMASEQIVGELTGELKRLGKDVVGRSLPLGARITGIVSPGNSRAVDGVPATGRTWEIGGDNWDVLFGSMKEITEASLKVLEARFEGAQSKFSITAKFVGKGFDTRDNHVDLKGKILLGWEKRSGRWQLVSWETKEFHSLETRDLFFLDVTGEATGGQEKAVASVHEQWIKLFLKGQTVPFHYGSEKQRYFAILESMEQHPGVSVVDIDGDGWDDFYVMARWGKNQLWRNLGDGTFEDISGEIGLDVDGMCSSALFADFDNDGDPDLFLGRTLERCRYYRNDSGYFNDRSSELVVGDLPYLCTSLSASDFNGDGLLDIYCCTYFQPASWVPPSVWLKDFLTPDQIGEWEKRRPHDHPVFRLTGPPNMLLVNRGGSFEPATQNTATELWLNSFQSTWSDFDSDGDPDLFVANDYGPDTILRNGRENGETVFTDVTEELTGSELQGFGMGISLGDYDNDGTRDLFLTYMFSKAGSRITNQLPNLENRVMEAARGNKMFRGTGSGFELVSGPEPPAVQVAATGWSWGGQFSDLDNDGYLDIYVPNGYYTAPEDVATEQDL